MTVMKVQRYLIKAHSQREENTETKALNPSV